MNNITLIGRTTKDIELKYSKSGLANCKFTLAVNRMKKDDPADFINCVAFGKTAEVVAEYVLKGHRLAVQGRIQTGSYDNKEGNKIFTTDVMVNNVEFLESKNGSEKEPQKPKPKKQSSENPVDEDKFPFR